MAAVSEGVHACCCRHVLSWRHTRIMNVHLSAFTAAAAHSASTESPFHLLPPKRQVLLMTIECAVPGADVHAHTPALPASFT